MYKYLKQNNMKFCGKTFSLSYFKSHLPCDLSIMNNATENRIPELCNRTIYFLNFTAPNLLRDQ